jgi:DNA-binding response OmpR family regulator
MVGSLEERLRGLNPGGAAYLAKPFAAAELFFQLCAVINARTAEHEI